MLTVLFHELGHAAGEDHSEDPDHFLNELLPTGVRRLPTAEDLDAIFSSGSSLESTVM